MAKYCATVGLFVAWSAAARLRAALAFACSCKDIIAGTQPQSHFAACSFFGCPKGVKPENMVDE